MTSIMRFLIRVFPALAFAVVSAFTSLAAIAFPLANGGQAEFIPAQPSSADTVYLKVSRTCAESTYFGAGYQTSTSNGKLRVTILRGVPPPCPIGGPPIVGPPVPPLFVEIGQLPAGIYALDLVESQRLGSESFIVTIGSNLPLAVTDHRATKTAPAVRLNYSDHWWDPANSGVGLFIWQNAADQLLAAWFTYGIDGKTVWYTIQAGSWTSATRYEGKLVQTSRPPNAGIDGPGPTTVQFVGSASLDFAGEDGALAGVFTYQLDSGGGAQTRNIRRFGK